MDAKNFNKSIIAGQLTNGSIIVLTFSVKDTIAHHGRDRCGEEILTHHQCANIDVKAYTQPLPEAAWIQRIANENDTADDLSWILQNLAYGKWRDISGYGDVKMPKNSHFIRHVVDNYYTSYDYDAENIYRLFRDFNKAKWSKLNIRVKDANAIRRAVDGKNEITLRYLEGYKDGHIKVFNEVSDAFNRLPEYRLTDLMTYVPGYDGDISCGGSRVLA